MGWLSNSLSWRLRASVLHFRVVEDEAAQSVFEGNPSRLSRSHLDLCLSLAGFVNTGSGIPVLTVER